jgi:antitoxin HicB
MVRTFAYPARIEPDEAGRMLVTFPDLPEALTDGGDLAEALIEAADALSVALAGRMLDGTDVPAPSALSRGQHLVAPRATVATKVAIYLGMRAAGVSAAVLARRLDVDHKEVRRILDPNHSTKMPRLEAALAALGQVVEIATRPGPGGAVVRLPQRDDLRAARLAVARSKTTPRKGNRKAPARRSTGGSKRLRRAS